jgi:CelD/BcsL family acetyltransferase involved in cellulose biosynthesis
MTLMKDTAGGWSPEPPGPDRNRRFAETEELIFMRDMVEMKRKNEIFPAGGAVTVEPLSNLGLYWQDGGKFLRWDCLFMIPPCLGAWWSYFGRGSETQLYVARHNEAILGMVPLTVDGDTAHLVRDKDLIDYGDFIIAPAGERKFFSTLFEYLRLRGIRRCDMGRIRADSTTISCLRSDSASFGWRFSCEPVDVLYEMDLPDTWEGYLGLLTGKERHETLRKMRRLEGAGNVVMRVVEDRKEVSDAMDAFVALFRSNRTDKARFMTGDIESFFRSLAAGMARAGLLKLFFLHLNDRPLAAAMCFDYNSTVYLYNNGYDRLFEHLSAGLMSKVFSIRESIRLGRKKYNFLRGSETYKGRLGGRPVDLLQCEVILK